jgi:hypothetical protein
VLRIPRPAAVVAPPVVANIEHDDRYAELRPNDDDRQSLSLQIAVKLRRVDPATEIGPTDVAPAEIVEAAGDIDHRLRREGHYHRIFDARSRPQMRMAADESARCE